MIFKKVLSAIKVFWFRSDESGQTLVEYGLVIGLIAVAGIVGLSLVAGEVDSLWGGIATEVTDAVTSVLG